MPPMRIALIASNRFLLNRHALWHAVVVLRDNVNHRPLCLITTGAAHVALTLAARKKSALPADFRFETDCS
jgi:hypothetical protein